eukprot:COSAG02_NODE_18574_length_931_cov_1.484375_1_plen_82_part_10
MSFLGVPLGNQGTGTVVKDGCGKIFYHSSIHSALRNALFLRTTTLGCVHPLKLAGSLLRIRELPLSSQEADMHWRWVASLLG